MAQTWIRKTLWIQGMIVDTSADRLEDALNNIDGVMDAKANYLDSNVELSYMPEKVSLKSIQRTIRGLGFTASATPPAPVVRTPVVQTPSRIIPEEKHLIETAPAPHSYTGTLMRKVLKIGGMTCINCEMRIEDRLKKMVGVHEVKVSYADATAKVGYDPRITSLSKIIEAIERLDYQVENNPRNLNALINGKQPKSSGKFSINQLLGIGIILLAGYLIIKNTIGFNFIPNISQNMGYGILFVVGLITSLHCVAMCGGINLSQCVSKQAADEKTTRFAKLKPSVLYNAGRVISYTVVGGIVGALGSVVSFSGTAKGIVAILAGVFMVIMGVNMLGIFPWMRRFTPHMPKIFGSKIHASSGSHSPFFVGLLNGLMPCGPLQAMQIYALGTGSFAKGALSMFVFSLGTVPLMFGFGAISSFLSSKFTHKMMTVSAALVIVLGIVMLNRGFALSGFDPVSALAPKSAGTNSGIVAAVNGNEQVVAMKLQAGSYTPFTVQKGVPVKWIVQADANSLNGCNGTITVPQYHISKTLQPGNNEIDFTPQQTGTITYTCSMGMISSTIAVVDDLSKVSASSALTDTGSGASSGTSGTGGNSATGNIGVAKIDGNEQDVTVTVNDGGYSPSILVLQKGVPAKIKFNPKQLTGCNNYVIFPELNGQINLKSQTETPLITPKSDFTFRCGMGMLNGYVKVVDDIKSANLNAIQKEAQNSIPANTMPGCKMG